MRKLITIEAGYSFHTVYISYKHIKFKDWDGEIWENLIRLYTVEIRDRIVNLNILNLITNYWN